MSMTASSQLDQTITPEIQTCTNQTSYNIPTGVISSCRSNQTGENISRGVKSTDRSIILLDGQHRLALPRKSKQVLSNFRCQSGRNDTPRVFSPSLEIRKHTIQSMNATIPDDDLEVKKDSVVYASEASTRDPVLEIIEQFLSWKIRENSSVDAPLKVKPLLS